MDRSSNFKSGLSVYVALELSGNSTKDSSPTMEIAVAKGPTQYLGKTVACETFVCIFLCSLLGVVLFVLLAFSLEL